MADVRIISWNIKNFSKNRYTQHRDIIHEQLYNGVNQLCDIFVIIEPIKGPNPTVDGELITSGEGYDGILALFAWLYGKHTHWKLVPPRASCAGSKADFVGVLYDSGKVELDGPDLDMFVKALGKVPDPWPDCHAGQAVHYDSANTQIDFEGRAPYLVKFAEAGAVALQETRTFDLKIAGPATAFTITSPDTLPSATRNRFYDCDLKTEQQNGAVTWSLKIGDKLPAGLSLNKNGKINGTPTAIESVSFTVEAEDTSKTKLSKTFTLDVKTIEILTSALPQGAPNEPYKYTLAAGCYSAPPAWSIKSGPLPADLQIVNGAISGIPQAAGVVALTVEARVNLVESATKVLTLTISEALQLNTPQRLPDGAKGASYNAQLECSGGYLPRIWSVTGGALPPSMELSKQGKLSGTPTADGDYQFTVAVDSKPGFFLVGLHAPPQGGKNYVDAANVLAVSRVPTIRELNHHRGRMKLAICGDFNVCNLACCGTKLIKATGKSNRDAFTAMTAVFDQKGFPADKTSLKGYQSNPKATLYADWKANSFDHVFTKGFPIGDVKNVAVVDLVALDADYAAASGIPIDKKKFNAIFRKVLWTEGVSDHLPVKFTLTI